MRRATQSILWRENEFPHQVNKISPRGMQFTNHLLVWESWALHLTAQSLGLCR